MRDDFAIFILTHGRPNAQLTLNTLQKLNYSGKWYLVLDDTDATIPHYIDNYPIENIIIFDKNHYINSDKYDNGDNVGHYKCIVYAKRAVEDIAKSMNLKSFVIADDDIEKFRLRYPTGDKLSSITFKDINPILDACCDYMLDCEIASLGFSFSQMFFGGISIFNNLYKFRIPYNFVFRNSNYDVDWKSWFGEDIITALSHNEIGQYWTIIPYVQQDISGVGSGKSDGGMSDVYNSIDSFKLAMCDFIFHPTSTKPYYYKNKFMSAIKKGYDCPMLISSQYAKKYCDE